MECAHFIRIAACSIITTIKNGTAITSPIMAAMVSGLLGVVVGEAVDEMAGVGGTSTVPETAIPTVAAVLSGLTDVWSVERMGGYEVYI